MCRGRRARSVDRQCLAARARDRDRAGAGPAPGGVRRGPGPAAAGRHAGGALRAPPRDHPARSPAHPGPAPGHWSRERHRDLPDRHGSPAAWDVVGPAAGNRPAAFRADHGRHGHLRQLGDPGAVADHRRASPGDRLRRVRDHALRADGRAGPAGARAADGARRRDLWDVVRPGGQRHRPSRRDRLRVFGPGGGRRHGRQVDAQPGHPAGAARGDLVGGTVPRSAQRGVGSRRR